MLVYQSFERVVLYGILIERKRNVAAGKKLRSQGCSDTFFKPENLRGSLFESFLLIGTRGLFLSVFGLLLLDPVS